MSELLKPYHEGKVLFIDKPLDWTSFDVVKKLRGVLKMKKIGHAGTLDPLATGLLIVCTGKKTKEIQRFQEMEKEYIGTFKLGQTTPSYDLETEVSDAVPVSHLSAEQIQHTAHKFTGAQMQLPPAYSAVKVQGKPAYLSARKGKKLKLDPRAIVIDRFEIERIELPDIHFRITCSKGTYIRSIARDFGEELQVGAHLTRLRRTRIGPHALPESPGPADFWTPIQNEMV